MEGWTTPDTVSAIIGAAGLTLATIDFIVSWRRAKQDRAEADKANEATKAIAEAAQKTADRVARAQEEQAGFATAQSKREASRDMRQRLEAFVEDLEDRQKYASNASLGLAIRSAIQEQDGYGGGDDGSIGAYKVLFHRIDDIREQAAVIARDLAVNRVTIDVAERELRRLDELLARVGDNEWPPKDVALPQKGMQT